MRTVPDTFHANARQVSARVRISRERPLWEAYGYGSPIPAHDAFAQTRVSLSGFGGVRQFIVVGNSVQRAEFVMSNQITTRTWVTLGPLPDTPITPEHCDISAYGNTLWCAVNGIVYRAALPDIGSLNWVQITEFVDPATGLHPITSIYAIEASAVVAACVYAGTETPDHCKIAVVTTTQPPDTFAGFLPRTNHKVRIAGHGLATGGLNETEGTPIRVYVDDWSGKKPVMLTRYAPQVWSAMSEILPMDALDDESAFSVGYVNTFPGGYYLTGTLKRRYGPAYSIYMLGPNRFTFGRDMIIQTGVAEHMGLFLGTGGVYAVGKNTLLFAPNPSIFAPIVGDPSEVYQFELTRSTNQPDHLSVDIPISETGSVETGDRVDLEVTANGSAFTKMGQFGISRTMQMDQPNGSSYTLDCIGHALKKMIDWESDTYFDYMGQGEVHGDPGDLTKLVRVSGANYVSEEGLRMEGLNQDGVLYTTPPASHGGFIQCKFTNVQSAHTMIGVGLNYGEETLAQAAERLGKKMEEIKAEERGKWGLFAIYNPNYTLASGSAALMLVDYNTIRVGTMENPGAPNPYRVIKFITLTRPASPATIRLAMQFQDGFARVYYALSDTADMILGMAEEAAPQWDMHPGEHDHYGRGTIFLRNNTGFHMSYPFTSESDVIPLYDYSDRVGKFGVPLDEKDTAFTATGTVQVNSEFIQYGGIAGWPDKRVWTPLEWVPGKVIGQSADGMNTPSIIGNITFAQSRGTRDVTPHVHGNNYLMQSISPPAGSLMNAIRVYLKKVNFPEDGLTLTVHSGKVADNWRLISRAPVLAQASISSSEISASGGWVTFFLSQEVSIDQSVYNAGDQYWFIIKRQRNHTHPSSTAYFVAPGVAQTSYAAGSAYVFCEEDDTIIGQGVDTAFVLYGRVGVLNTEYLLPVKFQSGVGLREELASAYWSGETPTALQQHWNGCAVTIVDGHGKNNCWRIVRSFRLTDAANDLMVFALDRDPGRIFDMDTRVLAVPAIYNLKRGQNNLSGVKTHAAAHGDKSMVHRPYSAFPKAEYFEYYTADEDMTVAEVAEMIARKAGVVEVDLANRHSMPAPSSTHVWPATWIPARSKNCIVKVSLPMLNTSSELCAVSFADNTAVVMYVLFGKNYSPLPNVQVKGYIKIFKGETLLLHLPYSENIKGDYRVSLYDGHLSVWLGGRLIGGVQVPEQPNWTRVGVGLASDTPGTIANVLIPEAGTRVDSFFIDMGKSAASLLTTLIGEKRIFFRENENGVLKIYTDRQMVPGTQDRMISRTRERNETGIANRVLLEGGEVVEVASSDSIAKLGNFFKTFNFHEINNLDDAAYFADIVLEDMALNREPFTYEGYADPRVEPTDKVSVLVDEANHRLGVVDSVSFRMQVTDDEATYDMNVSGRYYPQ